MRLRFALSILLSIGWLLTASRTAAASTTPPNVLLIIADDLRDTLGCYGNRSVKTPHLDRLAARGVRFEHAYAQYPVCNPSRTSLLTGLRCEQTRIVDNRAFFRQLLPNVVTLPQWLRQQGWWTGSYGKILHVGEAYGEFRHGWMDEGVSWDEARMFPPTSEVANLAGRNLTGGALAWCRWAALAGADEDQPDGQTATHVSAAIRKAQTAGRRWMIGAGFHRPHDPFVAPAKYFDLYPPGSLRLYRDPTNQTPVPPLSLPAGAFSRAFDAFTDVEREEYLRAYYACVSFMDAQVGRVLETLDQTQAWTNTVVLFLGDHGYHLGERNWWNKNTLFDRSCRAPLIVVAPDAQRGAVCRAPVEFVDLFPTIADYVGQSMPVKGAGQSLRPLLQQPSAPGKAAAFTLVMRGTNAHGQAVHTTRWHLNRWSDGTEELYDRENDPEETRNLAGNEAFASVQRELRQHLEVVGPYRPAKLQP